VEELDWDELELWDVVEELDDTEEAVGEADAEEVELESSRRPWRPVRRPKG